MPLSYPASCDFMVARPPTYEESMLNFQRQMRKDNLKKEKPKPQKRIWCNLL